MFTVAQTGTAGASAPLPAAEPQPGAPVTPPATAAAASGPSLAPTANGPLPPTTNVPPVLTPQPVVTQTPTTEPTPKAKPTGTPLLQPPPSVARPRPQRFDPSPFTRHTSLRYRSNPLSFLPLKDSGGYETLLEDQPMSAAPKLPAAVDALTEQSSVKPLPTGPSVASPGLHSTHAQPGLVYNGMSSAPASRPAESAVFSPHNAPLAALASAPQPYNPQPALQPNQRNPWPAQIQSQSQADKWLASAAQVNATTNGRHAGDGLLTTYNPFGEVSSQLEVLSSAWTTDLKTQLQAKPRNGDASRGNTASSQWGATPTAQKPKEDEFSFLASRHAASPGSPKSPADSNPFGAPRESQVHWV